MHSTRSAGTTIQLWDSMLARLQSGRRTGSGDKWFGMMRIAVNAASRMVFGVAVARLAGPDAFACFVGLVTVEVLAATLLAAGWITPFTSLAPRLAPEQRDALLHAGVRRAFRATAVCGAILLLAAPLASVVAAVPIPVHAAFCASTVAWLASSTGAAALTARFCSARALWAQGVAQLVPAAGLLWAALVPALDPLLAFFAGNALGHGLAAIVAWRTLPATTAAPDEAAGDQLARYGHVVLAGSVANSLCTRVQPFVLAAVAGAPAVAAFGAANTLVGPARVFSGAIGEVLRPRLALHQGGHGDGARGRRAVALGVGASAALGLALLVLFVVAGRPVGELVFGPGFEGLARTLPWAAAFVLVSSVVNVLVVAMQTRSLLGTATATKARIGAALLSLAAVWPACAADGAAGAFAAMTAAELVFLGVAVRFLAAAGGEPAAAAATVGAT